MRGAEVKPWLGPSQAVHELPEQGERRAGVGEPGSCEGGELAPRGPEWADEVLSPEIASASPLLDPAMEPCVPNGRLENPTTLCNRWKN